MRCGSAGRSGVKIDPVSPDSFFTENFSGLLCFNTCPLPPPLSSPVSLLKNGRRKESQVASGFREYVYVFAIASLHSQSCRSLVDFLMGGVSAV